LRWVSRIKVRCRLKRATEEGTWIANIKDISTNGIGLVINRPVHTGMSLTLEIPTQAGKVNKEVLVHVRHVKPIKNAAGNGTASWWQMGGEFSRKLTHEEIEFLRSRSPAILVQTERRTVVRHTTRFKQPIPVVRCAEEGPWFATIRNVSERGLSLIVDRPFKQGMLLTVELPDKRGNMSFSRLFRVLHVRRQGTSPWWVIGGMLLSPLQPAEVRELL
jgi:hypothetical protein